MRARAARVLPSGEGWTFEPALGGMRAIALAHCTSPRVATATGRDVTARVPRVADALRALAVRHGATVLLDGELVGNGRPARQRAARRDAGKRPGTRSAFVAFDLLAEGARDLRRAPWLTRRQRLEACLRHRTSRVLRLGESVPGDGTEMLRRASDHGWEGVVAKRTDAPYASGSASAAWLAVSLQRPRAEDRGAGRSEGRGRGGPRGARHAAGGTQSGTSSAFTVEALLARLEAIERAGGSGVLRVARGASVELSNLDKEFFPGEHLTKGDLMRYYVRVSPAVLPTLANRPLVLKRTPDGIGGEMFFQQNAPDPVPSGVRVEELGDGAEGTARRFVGGDLATLLYTVQLGCVSVDPWLSRVGSLDTPDYAVLDLDPGPGAGFRAIVRLALWLRDELDDLGLRGVPKTSGSRGMHIAIPLPPRTTYDTALAVARLAAGRVAAAHPEHATVERALERRPRGAIYIDCLQNMRGKSVAGVYAVRARPGATVSTPLGWEEVTDRLDPAAFTLRTLPERLARVGDLWARGMRQRNTVRAVRDAAARWPAGNSGGDR